MIIFRKLILCISGCFFCATLTSQTSRIDSLIQALDSDFIKGNDLEKGMLLLDISEEYMLIDTTKCLMYMMEALHLAQKTGLEKIERDAYFALGNYYSLTDQPYLSYINYKKVEKLYLKHNDRNRLCGLYHNLMTLFYEIEDMDNVAYYADKILETVAEHYDLTTLMPKDVSFDTLTLSDRPYNLTSLIFGAQFFKGMARYQNNDSQEALDYFLDMLRKSILLNTEYSYPCFVAWQCGKIYIQQNQPREALRYLNWVREDFEAREESGNLPSAYAYIAEAYAMLHQTDSAEYFMNRAWEFPMVYEDTKLELYRVRSMIDFNRNDYRNALESYKKYHYLSDSLSKAGKTAEIAQMRNWYELEQKDNENMLLQQEHQKQRTLIFILQGALAIIFVLFAIAVFFYRKNHKKNRELKELHGVKDKLFSVVAHDLRSPIGSLMSLLMLANENMLDAEMQAQLFKDISNEVDDIYGLLDNLLRWSKSQMRGIVPTPTYFDAHEASCEVTDTLQSIAASKKIVLVNSIERLHVYTERDMFSVVVRNLTTNALKYTSAGGEVTLSSELSGNNMLVISVKDTGIGMPKEVQDKLFKLSETKSRRGTKNESGVGLGLILCADFVKANGGSIWFTSKQGEGSTFSFSIQVK